MYVKETLKVVLNYGRYYKVTMRNMMYVCVSIINVHIFFVYFNKYIHIYILYFKKSKVSRGCLWYSKMRCISITELFPDSVRRLSPFKSVTPAEWTTSLVLVDLLFDHVGKHDSSLCDFHIVIIFSKFKRNSKIKTST